MYSTTMIPIIALFLMLMTMVFISIVALARELIDKGCLTWHRDALGRFLQNMVILICCLVACFHLKDYIKDLEENPN
jgi:hypothetical protein